MIREKIKAYSRLMRLDKPIGTLLLLWPTLWSLWIASSGHPPLKIFLIFCAGTLLMRSAGCVMNDLADRHFDRQVKRTQHRPLAKGEVTIREALGISLVLIVVAFGLVLWLNPLTQILSIIALLLAATYPFAKRFILIPQAYLGIAFGFGIPMAYAAVTNTTPWVAWLILLANVFWTLAYDTEYAMVDLEDDLALEIYSSAKTFGRFEISLVMASYVMMLGLMALVGYWVNLGWTYKGSLIIALGISLYHYTLIKSREPSDCFKAFLHNNWLGAAIFMGIFFNYL
jgi:4-hydroxybenzoate polyprenyltransferase